MRTFSLTSNLQQSPLYNIWCNDGGGTVQTHFMHRLKGERKVLSVNFHTRVHSLQTHRHFRTQYSSLIGMKEKTLSDINK